MRPNTPSRHAVTFVFVTVLLDMVGFGLIIPVVPRLIQEVGGVDLHRLARQWLDVFCFFRRAVLVCSGHGEFVGRIREAPSAFAFGPWLGL